MHKKRAPGSKLHRKASNSAGAQANRDRLLRVQAEARRIRASNPSMKQKEAVSQAWVAYRAGRI